MTYEDAKRRLATRGLSDGWTADDVRAQEIVCAVEGIPEPESLRVLREVYAQATAKLFRPTFGERVAATFRRLRRA